MENEKKDELGIFSNNESDINSDNSVFPETESNSSNENEVDLEKTVVFESQATNNVDNGVVVEENKAVEVEVSELITEPVNYSEPVKNESNSMDNSNLQSRVDVSTGGSNFNELLQNKKQFAAFIMFAIGALVSLVYLFKMNLAGMTLIYVLLLCAGGAGLAYFCYSTKKKNSTITFVSLLVLVLGFLLRVVQCSNNMSIEYTIRYLAFFIGTLLIFYNIYKSSNKNNKGLVTLLLLVGAGDAIYLFFSLGSVGFLGYTWRLFLVGEALVAAGLMLCDFSFDAFANLNNSLKNVTGKLPKAMVIVVITVILAVVLYGINALSDDSNSTYDPMGDSNAGSIIDNKNDSDDDDYEEEEDKVEFADIYKNKATTVKTTYRSEEYEAEISVSEVYTTDDVLPPKPYQYYYTHYVASDDKTYLVVVLNVKNIGAKTINSDYVFTNFLGDNCVQKAIFDGKYEYTSGTVVGLDKDSDGEFDFDSYYYIKALETVQLYVLYEIADEVSNKAAVINSCFGDLNLRIHN